MQMSVVPVAQQLQNGSHDVAATTNREGRRATGLGAAQVPSDGTAVL